MAYPRRPYVFLLVNLCLSAAVTGTILLIYDRATRRDCLTPLAIASGEASAAPLDGAVSILGVIGPGSPADEVVLVQNAGQESLPLAGWTLQNGQDRLYTFPQLTLYPGGLIKVHTADGEDSASDLYLGRSSAAWESGQLVVLYDGQQVARALYRIP